MFIANAPKVVPNSTSFNSNTTIDLQGQNKTVTSLSGAGTVTNSGAKAATLTNTGPSSTFSGVIQDGASATALTENGSGYTLTLTGTNTYTGVTTIQAGTLALSGSGSIARSSGVVDNGAFDISATASGATIETLSGSGAVRLGSRTLILSNASGTFGGVIGGTGALTLTAGIETLSGANAYTRVTTIAAAGTLALSGGGSIAASSGVWDKGTFDIAATASGATIKTLSGSGAVKLGARTLTLSNASGAFGGAIGGTGGLTLTAGTERLSGTNTYTGVTTISSGTLALSGAGSIAQSSGVVDDGTFDISATTSGA